MAHHPCQARTTLRHQNRGHKCQTKPLQRHRVRSLIPTSSLCTTALIALFATAATKRPRSAAISRKIPNSSRSETETIRGASGWKETTAVCHHTLKVTILPPSNFQSPPRTFNKSFSGEGRNEVRNIRYAPSRGPGLNLSYFNALTNRLINKAQRSGPMHINTRAQSKLRTDCAGVVGGGSYNYHKNAGTVRIFAETEQK